MFTDFAPVFNGHQFGKLQCNGYAVDMTKWFCTSDKFLRNALVISSTDVSDIVSQICMGFSETIIEEFLIAAGHIYAMKLPATLLSNQLTHNQFYRTHKKID